MSVLKDKYQNEVVKALKASGKYPSPMDIPRLSKVVVNMGVNTMVDRDMLKAVADDLAKITGQRPAITHATKISIPIRSTTVCVSMTWAQDTSSSSRTPGS